MIYIEVVREAYKNDIPARPRNRARVPRAQAGTDIKEVDRRNGDKKFVNVFCY